VNNGEEWDDNGTYPLVDIQTAIEDGHRFIVDLAINSMVDLSTSLCKRLPEGKGQMELGFRLEHVGPSILVGMPREMPRFIINHYYRAIFHSLCEFTG
jgi:hypothetical protein